VTAQRGPTPSGKRPATGVSSKRTAPASANRSSRSGRTQPKEESGDDQAMIKKVMFIGSAVLVVALVVLMIVKWNALFGPKKVPPKAVVVDETKQLDEVDVLAKKAADQFAAAKKISSTAERNKAIRAAIETLAAAQEKLVEMSERPQYRGGDYDQVFDERQHRLSQEMKYYRDSIKIGE